MVKRSVIFCTIVIWWWYFITITKPVSCLMNDTDDHLSLMAFKEAIDEDPFGALSSWNDSLHYCNWNGVLCSPRHPLRVIALSFISQGLVGSVSPHIGNLSFLRSISLRNNSFHGKIPPQVGSLFRLQRIDFSNNSLSGEIPTNLSRCSNLVYLNLIDNHLKGNIPAELGSLSKLGALGLSKNQFSGTIPRTFGNLSYLSRLSLLNCGLEEEIPEEIARLQALSFFQVSENALTGMIPFGLYNISTMRYFAVAHNQLQGTIPPDIGFLLPNVKTLDFIGNGFRGMIPPSLTNASGLEFIYFSRNDFTGPMPRDLGRLSSLQGLMFSINQIRDDLSFISSLTNCSSLQVLAVEINLLNGSLPTSIANLSSQLRVLAMEDNQISGSIPSGMENFLNLNYLSMSQNYFSGPVPAVFGKLHRLQELFLDRNRFTGQIPSSLGNLSLLNLLYLAYNNLHGRIPPALGQCRNLLNLDLAHNNFSGSIPQEIMSLSSISILFSLGNNALTGSLPSEVGSLRNLGELDLSNNRLSGLIPSYLSNCVSLERLYLQGNSFYGEIPQGLSSLLGLEELDLSRNNFTGLIPNYLGSLHLKLLNLSFNGLQGDIPIKGVFRNASAISVAGNNELCGGIKDLKLPPCVPSNSKKRNLSKELKVIIPIVIFVVMCLSLSVFFFICLHRRRISRKKASSTELFENHFLRLSYADLLKATDEFSNANLIGVGGCGSVYKGILDQGQTLVAVKVLNLHLRGASKSFISECNALRFVRHRNLLKILSACSGVDFQGNDFKAIVYEFMANGSLENWLHQDGVGLDGHQEETRNLELIQRLYIAIDVAYALEYLHFGSESTVVHGDLKPSNVLLDEELTAQIGDFGLAKVISTVSSEHHSNSVAVKGTVGYVAPEYGMGGMVSTQGDVYSYGILVLEMFTSKRPADDAFKDDLNLHSFVNNFLPDKVMDVVDPRIVLQHDTTRRTQDCIVSILRIGVACSMELPRERMEMRDVVRELIQVKNLYLNEGLNQ